MAAQNPKVSMPGVAEGKILVGVPTGDDVSAADRVKALFHGSMSEEIFQVSYEYGGFSIFKSLSFGL